MLSEHLEDEPWHDPLRHSLGASRVSGVPVPLRNDRSPAGFRKASLEHFLKTIPEMPPGNCRWNSSCFGSARSWSSRHFASRQSSGPQGNIEPQPVHLVITRPLEHKSGAEAAVFASLIQACRIAETTETHESCRNCGAIEKKDTPLLQKRSSVLQCFPRRIREVRHLNRYTRKRAVQPQRECKFCGGCALHARNANTPQRDRQSPRRNEPGWSRKPIPRDCLPSRLASVDRS